MGSILYWVENKNAPTLGIGTPLNNNIYKFNNSRDIFALSDTWKENVFCCRIEERCTYPIYLTAIKSIINRLVCLEFFISDERISTLWNFLLDKQQNSPSSISPFHQKYTRISGLNDSYCDASSIKEDEREGLFYWEELGLEIHATITHENAISVLNIRCRPSTKNTFIPKEVVEVLVAFFC